MSAEETFGEALRRARGALGLTLREFAVAVQSKLEASGFNLSFNHVALWRLEKGVATNPHPDLVAAFDELAGTGEELRRKAKDLSPSVVIAQIPPVMTGFVGRSAEWAQLDPLLSPAADDDVVALNGPPGVGKTETVVQWYHARAERIAARYPGGAVWVDLRGHDGASVHPDAALEKVLLALRVPASAIPTRGERRVETYHRRCAQQPVLVLLDNAVSAEQVLPLLPPPGACRAVVTSRQRLDRLRTDRGARDLTMAPLTPREAQDLLDRRVGGSRIEEEPDAAAAVAALCGYLPLALTLSAAYLGAHPQQPVRVLQERLAQEEDRLDLLAAGDVHIRGAFELSYEILPPASQQVFRYLGLHPSPEISVDAAATLVDRSVSDTRNHLESLAASRLLEEIGPDRYRVHDLLRVFAAERSQQEDSETARSASMARILAYYLRTAATATRNLSPHTWLPVTTDEPSMQFDSHFEATQWFTAERSNLHAAAQAAYRQGDLVLTWHLAVVQGAEVTTARTPWQNTHLLALRAARTLADPRATAWCAQHLGLHHCQLREWSDAQTYLQQALTNWRKAGDRQGEAWTLWALARLTAERGDPHAAVDLYQGLLDWVDDDYLRATVAGSMGEAYCRLQPPNPEAATDILHQALRYFSQESAPAAEAGTAMRLAEAWRLQRNLKTALKLLDRAYTCFVTIGDQSGVASVLLRRAQIHSAMGDLSRARKAAEAAKTMFADDDDPRQDDAAILLTALTDAAP